MVEKTKAYIAGFLDGDGSIYLQLMRRKDYRLGFQVRACITFYQKSTNKRILRWLLHKFCVGFIRDRNDGMSEYSIIGLNEVQKALLLLGPYLLLKRKQAKLALRIISRFNKVSEITPGFLLRIAKEVDKFGKINYSMKRTITTATVRKFFQTKTLNPRID